MHKVSWLVITMEDIFLFRFSSAFNMGCPSFTSNSPIFVNVMIFLLSRLKSFNPISFSIFFIAWLNAGWLMCRNSDAFEKLLILATIIAYSRSLLSITFICIQHITLADKVFPAERESRPCGGRFRYFYSEASP